MEKQKTERLYVENDLLKRRIKELERHLDEKDHIIKNQAKMILKLQK